MFGARIKNLTNNVSPKLKRNTYERIIDHVFKPMILGRLTMLLPDGRVLTYGHDPEGICAEIRITNNDFFRKCVLFGDVGFGESFVDGDWETGDIAKVIEWMIINVEHHPTLMSDKKKRAPVNFLKMANNFLALVRRNSVRGSRKNIGEHYDLGNDFYKLFLDPSMTYSSAYFKRSDQALEDAQYQKYEELCQKLKLHHLDHVLEIGSGWGGFAMYAAKNFGCRVTTVTVSSEQFEYARQKIKEAGLDHKVDVLFMDYRKIEGKFNKIVSIEMLEAVGHEYYQAYFQQCHNLLKKDGLLAVQVILSPDHRYESFRKNMDWIQKHVFPGSLLPSLAVIQENINKTGDLTLLDFEDITPHYVKTLGEWHKMFNLRKEDIFKLGRNGAFIRKWNYYFCYCMAAFKTRNISVAQIVFTRPNNLSLMRSK